MELAELSAVDLAFLLKLLVIRTRHHCHQMQGTNYCSDIMDGCGFMFGCMPSGGCTGLPGRRRKAYNRQMKYISEWHSFDPKSAQTYPKIDAPLQVRYANGAERKGSFKELFSPRKTSLDTKITGWRYLK
jgi:hypothetical protein